MVVKQRKESVLEGIITPLYLRCSELPTDHTIYMPENNYDLFVNQKDKNLRKYNHNIMHFITIFPSSNSSKYSVF
jgi:hypothetical protein